MAAIPKKLTYFLSPNCEILPEDAALSLGSIIADPLDPENTVLNDSNHALVPAENIKTTVLHDWRSTIGKLRQHKLTIWASFLQLFVGLGFDIDGSYKNDKEDVYKFERLETKSFSVDKEYVNASLAADGVTGFLKAARWKDPVFMVTGVKIAYGAHIISKRKNGWGAGGALSGDGTAIGVPVSGGPKVENSVSSEREVEIKGIPALVFAYRLSKIKVRQDRGLKLEPYNKGALFGMKRDEPEDVNHEWRLDDVDVGSESLEGYQILEETICDDDEENAAMYVIVKPTRPENII